MAPQTVSNATVLHPDDVLFFTEVRSAMQNVAKAYELPLRAVEPLPMPKSGMANRMGDCSHSGLIRIVLRCTVNGEWCEEPMSPAEVWDTAAHELAHLRHMNHGIAFQEFALELTTALKTRREDHREKVLNRLVKMQRQRQSEAEIGNAAAAEAFATAINRMLLEYELHPSDIDYAAATDHDPVIEVKVNFVNYNVKVKKSRIAWQESLARVVAKAHLCQFLIRAGSNDIWFVGTRSHATVAEYAFGTLVAATDLMSRREYVNYEYRCRHDGQKEKSHGFREAWLSSFIERINERFEEARKAVVADCPNDESKSTALIRLEGALVKTRKYVDDKFKSRRGVAALSLLRGKHADGAERGRAAADRMVIGRKGVHGGKSNAGLLGDGK